MSAGLDTTTTQTASNSAQHISEATKKAAHSLKTLHKIEVRGVTETTTRNRMTRVIRNPLPDRTLSLNVFQLIKHFSVETRLAEVWPALIIQVDHMTFNPDFVINYSSFLRDNLMDSRLVEDLITALRGAEPVLSAGSLEKARDVAKLALVYLYGAMNIFNMPKVSDAQSYDDQNKAGSSFIASRGDHSGLGDAIAATQGDTKLGAIFTVLNFFHKVYSDIRNQNKLDESAISIASAIADGIAINWEALDARKMNNMFDQESFTEIFRRVPGFLAMVSGMLKPLMPPADEESKTIIAHEQAAFVLDRLVQHLKCNEHYYIQRFLDYMAIKTRNQAIIDFVYSVMQSRGMLQPSLPPFLDVERSFVDRQQIMVPSFQAFDNAHVNQFLSHLGAEETPGVFSIEDVHSQVAEVDVPCDGIHLEVAEGTCILEGLSAQSTQSVELAIQNASFKLSPYGPQD